jgi:hypothetical protein
MTIYFSAQTVGFYIDEIHGENIPSDAVEITKEEYIALLNGQSSGNSIIAGENGAPILVPQITNPLPQPTKEELMAKLLEIQAQLEKLV